MLLLLILFHSLCLSSAVVSVTTPYGQINGFIHTSSLGKPGEVFLGIKYGVAPRFRKPYPITYYGNADATRFGPMCPQVDGPQKAQQMATSMSEDCLVLNVYAPPRGTGKSPVMVYIHGGKLSSGHGNIDPDVAIEHFTSRGVVLVTVQYRLGFLGFFSIKHLLNEKLANSTFMQSNVGLADQMLALKWIQKNIGSFGGNSESVTLFGQSAGACSVSALHMTGQRNLFQRVILQSGTAEVCFDGTFGYRDLAVKLAKMACSIDIRSKDFDKKQLKQLEKCMEYREIDLILENFEKNNSMGWYFTNDDWLLKDTSQGMIDKFSIRRDMIIGITRDEWAAFELELMKSGMKSLDKKYYNWRSVTKFVSQALGFAFPRAEMKKEMSAIVSAYNFSMVNGTVEGWLETTVDVFTDAIFANRAIREAYRYASLGGNVYVYEFTEPSGVFKLGDYKPVVHADDRTFLMNSKKEFAGAEMARLWTDFAHGIPPSKEQLSLAKWNYLEINNHGVTERVDFRRRARQLWSFPGAPLYMDYPKLSSKKAWMHPSKTPF